MKKSKNNRYYCHRRNRTGVLKTREKTIEVPFNQDTLCKYSARLRDVYGYSIQMILI